MQSPASASPRRVALVINHLRVGGAEAQLVRLAERLVANGDDVTLISLLPTEAYAKEMKELGVPIVELAGGRVRSLAFVVQARRVLEQLRPAVVISFLYQSNVVARVAGRLSGADVIVSSIRNENFGGRGRELIMRLTDRLATITTTNSTVARDSLVRRNIVPAERIVVVPNGVDVAGFAPDARRRSGTRAHLGVDDATFVWLAAGRLEAQKDIPTLLRAFATHRGVHPATRLAIAGGGALEHELRAEADALGVGDAVAFLGVRSDIPDLMRAADGFVLSSAWEGLPNAVMEAMAAGLPVVSTIVGGVRELVDDPGTGTLVPAKDPVALAAAMNATVALDADGRAALGARARAKIQRDWSTESAGRQWLALVDACIGGERLPTP
ncbi:MAG TPA: glycosyltransferase [Acidimicrobiales bacterium]|nr:glycosyltransferase [Acidimicrobiales bacterium]